MGHFNSLHLFLFCMVNHVYLSHGVQVADATWQASMRIVARVGDLVQMIGDS
jgi:hypothetical protein